MTLRLLRILIAIVEFHAFGAAAQVVHTTRQAAIADAKTNDNRAAS